MDKEQIHKEVQAVKELGEQIGYGNMMCMASALWRESLSSKGYPKSGAFVASLIDDVKIEDQEDHINFMSDLEHYDKLIKL